MRVCLVGAPTVTEFEEVAEAESEQVRETSSEPQLGILSLAAVLEQTGCPVEAIDLNRLYYRFLADRGCSDDFAAWAGQKLAEMQVETFAFSSICSSYPLTIRLASEVKRRRPDSVVLFGGPQASVVDRETLATFPFVDFVLRGEAERTLPILLEELASKRSFRRVPGLTFRDGYRVSRNPNAPVIEDLDLLPIPAYHLIENLDELEYASLELGRGCPFACKFCSTNDFFRRRFRLKSPGRMLAEMRQIAKQFGFRRFDLIHDMFTVDRKRVVAFCEELLASGDGFRWSCSARTDCIDEELIQLMAEAGCTGVFFGVEAGSERIQKLIDKHLDIPKAKAMVEAADRRKIQTTVSLIAGFPEEEMADLKGTVEVYMHAARLPSASPQINLLAPLAGTPIHLKHRDDLVLAELCSDLSHQGRFQNAADRLLIETHPDLFPNFYLLPTPHLDRGFVLELREFLLMATARFRWLLAALDLANPGILPVFAAWRDYRIERRPMRVDGDLRHYYRLRLFRQDFNAFLRERPDRWRSPLVWALLDYEAALENAIAEEASLPPLPDSRPVERVLKSSDRLRRRPRVYTFGLGWDIDKALEAIQRGTSETSALKRNCFYATRPLTGESTRLAEIGEKAAFILNLSTGELSLDQIACEFSLHFDSGRSSLRRAFCKSLAQSLVEREYLSIFARNPDPALLSKRRKGSATDRPWQARKVVQQSPPRIPARDAPAGRLATK